MAKLPFEIVDVKRNVQQSRATNKSPVERFADQVQQQIDTYNNWVVAGMPDKLLVDGGEGKSKAVRMWWFQQGGVWFMSVKYGIAALDMGNGKSNVKCGEKHEDVLAVLSWLKDNADKEPVKGWVDAADAIASKRTRKRKEAKAE